MNKYETLFIVHPDATEEDVDAAIARITGIIEKAGKVTGTDKWGKKKLAYEIKKVREGYYNLITFEAEASVLEELNHIYRITENILRGIYVRLDD